jgi:hypothetical protein
VFSPPAENPDRPDRDHEEAEVGPKERPRSAREKPAQHICEPRAEKQAHEDGRGTPVSDRDEAKKSPAKLVTEIKSQAEVKKR